MSAANCPIEVNPYAVSGTLQSPSVFSLNYTNQDFWSMKSRLIDYINQNFGPDGTELPNTFNDLVEGDVAIMLIENWAFLADTLSFKMDQQVNELFIDTVTQIDNAFRLAKLVGFVPTPPIAAAAMFVATINNPLTTDLVITTPVSIDISSNNISATMELFQSDANNSPLFGQDIVISAGSTSSQSIVGLEGRTRTETLAGTGAVAQSIQLSYFPVIYGSIQVSIDGVMWEQVDYFTDSQPRREYRSEYDSSYNAYLMFGNGKAGLIPSSNSSIQVTYRIGGGTVGNIVTGYVSTQLQVPVPGYQYSVPVSVKNYTKGQYGYNGDGVDDIRRKLPEYVQTQGRAVSGTDYKTLTDQFVTPYHGQIGKSVAALRNHGCAGNIIDLYILALSNVDDLATASNELKVDLNDMLNSVKMMTDNVCIRDGVVLLVDVTIDVTMDKFYRKFELENRTNITNSINAFFDLTQWDFGQTLKDPDVSKALSGIQEINDLTINFTTNDVNNEGTTVTTKFFEIIRPDVITISFMYT